MKYNEIKSVVASMVDEFMEKGETQEEAEMSVLGSGVSMLQDGKLGFLDLKYMFQFLGYAFSGELEKTMNQIKKTIQKEYSLDKFLRQRVKEGKAKDDACKEAIHTAYEAFQEGDIEEPEQLDMILWSMGYRLTDDFFKHPENMKKTIEYEIDE